MLVSGIYCSGQFHLGYSEEELVDKSWYELLHPQDLNEAVSKHMQCMRLNNRFRKNDKHYRLIV